MIKTNIEFPSFFISIIEEFTTLYHLIFIVKIKIIMKVSIIGNGLTSLTLAKMLVNHGISVDIFSNNKEK